MDLEKIKAYNAQQAEQADVQKQDANHQEIVGSLNNLLMATLVSKDPKMVEVAQNLAELLSKIGDASSQFENSSLHLLPMANHNLANAINDLTAKIELYSPHDLQPYFQELVNQLNKIASTPPVVNVPTQPVTVDLRPLISAIKAVETQVKSNKVDIPKNDFSAITDGLKDVSKTINELRFPVPNFIQDPYIRYKPVDEYDDGVSTSVKYYGFLTPEGNWYIMKYDPSASAKTFRYAFGGENNYETNWTNRASLTYGYPLGK